MWQKLGLILDADDVARFSVSHAAIPFAHKLQDGRYRIFFASRDTKSRSHMFCGDMDFSLAQPRMDKEGIREIMGLGELGAFDDSGVMPGWAVNHDGSLYMYYSGWSLGQTVPYYFYIGLARSKDHGHSFERVSRAPIVGRSLIDPFLTASACVIKENDVWRMWYVSGRGWEQQGKDLKHYYYIRHAISNDGIVWTPSEQVCIDFASEDEYAIARPAVVAVEGGYLMWYSYRGNSYRLGLAVSRDGLTWHRVDDKVGMDVSASGWDSQMLAYGHIFHANNRWWMLYNGSDYGKSGIGLACAEELPSVTSLLGR